MPYQKRLKASGPNGAWEPIYPVAVLWDIIKARGMTELGGWHDVVHEIEELKQGGELETPTAVYRYVPIAVAENTEDF